MILNRPSTRLAQPQGPVEIDTSNPLTRGVVVAWVPGSSRNIQDGTPASVNGVLSVGPYGYMQATTGTQKAFLVPDAPSQRTPTFTSYAILRRVSTLPPNFDGVGKNWQSNSATTYISDTIAYNPSGGGQNAITAIFGKSGGTTASPVHSVQDTSQWHSIASTHNGSTGSLYVGGVLRSTVAVQPVVYGSSGDNSFGTNTSGKSGSMEYALVLRWNRALSASEIALLESNPWQLFRPVRRRIYFDLGSIAPPSDHVLTAESAIQQILSEVDSVAQENTLAGGISVQSAVSSDGVIQQINALIGENSFSNNLSAVAALAQLNILQGNNQQTINLSSDSSVSQINNLSALSTAVEIASSSAGILQSNILLASSCLVPNYSTSGSIALVPVIDLSGNSVSQYDLSSSSSLLQDHVLAQNASEQPVLSSSDAAVQTHVLISDNSTQIILSSSGAIGTSGELLGNNAQQTNASSSGFVIQASFLQGNIVKQMNLSSSGAITQGGELPPLTDAEIRQMFAMLQVAVAKLQTRIDAVL